MPGCAHYGEITVEAQRGSELIVALGVGPFEPVPLDPCFRARAPREHPQAPQTTDLCHQGTPAIRCQDSTGRLHDPHERRQIPLSWAGVRPCDQRQTSHTAPHGSAPPKSVSPQATVRICAPDQQDSVRESHGRAEGLTGRLAALRPESVDLLPQPLRISSVHEHRRGPLSVGRLHNENVLPYHPHCARVLVLGVERTK